MKRKIEPQIVFIYNNIGQIKKTIFLSYDDEEFIIKSKQYELFEFLKKYNSELFQNTIYEILHDHILLTLNLLELRGYIQKRILKTNLKIIVFSLWNNIDYRLRDETIFNPFSNDIFEKNPDNLVLYEVYKQVASNAIFCIIDEENISNNICLDGECNDTSIYNFTKSIIDQDLTDIVDIELTYDNINKSVFDINWFNNIINYINKITIANKITNEYYYNEFFLSGDKLILVDDVNEIKIQNMASYIDIYIYKNDSLIDKNVLTIKNDYLYINDPETYEQIISIFPQIENMIIKEKKTKQNIRIDFNLSISSILEISFEIDFFIEPPNKTKNIFSDRTKHINIIASSDHMLFTSRNIQYDLFKYITLMIIGLQIHNKKVDFNKKDIKIGTRYYSRYCQGNRKPKTIENLDNIDMKNYTSFNDVYFKSKNPDKFDGDIIIDNEKKKHLICKEEDLKNIGFINEIYKGYNICLPCCYKKVKSNTDIFKVCVYGIKKEMSQISIAEPYFHIFKQLRVIMDQNKIGMLLNKPNLLFNTDIKVLYEHEKMKIKEISLYKILNSNYSLEKTLNKLKDLKNDQIDNNKIFEELCKLYFHLKIKKVKNQKIYVLDDNSETNKYLTPEFYNELKKMGYDKFIKETLSRDKFKKNTISFFENQDQYLLINKHHRIELSKNYIVYTANDKAIDLKHIEDIKNLTLRGVFIIDDSVYFKPELILEYNNNKKKFIEDINFYLIIQNKVHILKSICKRDFNGHVEIEPLPFFIKERVLEKIFNVNGFNFIKTKDNIISNQKHFIVDGSIKSYPKKTKYNYSLKRIILNKDSLGYYIVNILYKKYFSLIYIENIELFKISFLTNLLNIINFDINLNSLVNIKKDKEILLSIIEHLNPLYVNEKELRKITYQHTMTKDI